MNAKDTQGLLLFQLLNNSFKSFHFLELARNSFDVKLALSVPVKLKWCELLSSDACLLIHTQFLMVFICTD